MKVRAYLEFVAAIKDVPRAQRREAVDRVLERCGLTGVAGRVSGKLSKGFRQRVGLAQAIVHEPRVLVLDEPTVGLDPIQIREIRDLIGSLASPGEAGVRQTVILSTHILNEVEAICQRVIMLNNGRMALDQPLAELTGGGRSLEEVFARTTSRDDGAGARVAGVADGDGSGGAGAAGAARP
jgi:ABC-2 type transport system ATP-binding protein